MSFEPYGSLVDTHVDIESAKVSLFLLGLQPALNEVSNLLIICHSHHRN